MVFSTRNSALPKPLAATTMAEETTASARLGRRGWAAKACACRYRTVLLGEVVGVFVLLDERRDLQQAAAFVIRGHLSPDMDAQAAAAVPEQKTRTTTIVTVSTAPSRSRPPTSSCRAPASAPRTGESRASLSGCLPPATSEEEDEQQRDEEQGSITVNGQCTCSMAAAGQSAAICCCLAHSMGSSGTCGARCGSACSSI